MGVAGPSGPRRRRARAVLLVMAALSTLAACSSSGPPQAAGPGTEAAARDASDPAAGVAGGFDDATAFPSESSMAVPDTVPTGTPPNSAPPFARMPRSAAPKARSTALLTGVRTGSHDGFERIVFEFAGDARPGYQVEWVDGPVAARGSGKIVDVAGSSRLRIVFEPASGIDLETGDITYVGPNRMVADGSPVLEVVRTDDFEAVMTWVASTDRVAPFRVLTLSDPTRVVVDVAVPPAR